MGHCRNIWHRKFMLNYALWAVDPSCWCCLLARNFQAQLHIVQHCQSTYSVSFSKKQGLIMLKENTAHHTTKLWRGCLQSAGVVWIPVLKILFVYRTCWMEMCLIWHQECIQYAWISCNKFSNCLHATWHALSCSFSWCIILVLNGWLFKLQYNTQWPL